MDLDCWDFAFRPKRDNNVESDFTPEQRGNGEMFGQSLLQFRRRNDAIFWRKELVLKV